MTPTTPALPVSDLEVAEQPVALPLLELNPAALAEQDAEARLLPQVLNWHE